jgi:hypothetical protein
VTEIDQILLELTELRHKLEAMDGDDPRRTSLEDRRADLQHRARILADTARNPDYLRMELDHLEKRLAKIQASQIKPSLVEGHRWINDPSAYARSINRRIAESNDDEAAALTKRIGELRQALGLPPLPAPPPDPSSRKAGKG